MSAIAHAALIRRPPGADNHRTLGSFDRRPDMPWWVFAVVLADVAVTLLVIRYVLARRAKSGEKVAGGLLNVDFRALRQFTEAAHPRIGDYVRANWSGSPTQLAEVLRALLDELERDAKNRGLELERDVIKNLIGRSLDRHKIARGTELKDALAKVA
jgi:hypothetical protein